MGILLLFAGLLAAPAAQPPACGTHSLVYHDKLGMVLLVNCGEGEQKGVVWGWNGRKWEQVSSDAPSPREIGEAVYDSRRNVLVMYGGLQVHNGEPHNLAETWEWDGQTWNKMNAAPRPMSPIVLPWLTTPRAARPCFTADRVRIKRAKPAPGSGTESNGKTPRVPDLA